MAKKRSTRRRRSTAVAKRRRGGIARRASKMLPVPRVTKSLYVSVALLAGRLLREMFDLQMVDEGALGLYFLAVVTKGAETRQCFADVAVGMQLLTMADDAGVTDQITALIGQ